MGVPKRSDLSEEQRLVLIALSLGTDELKNGLNLLLHFAQQFASDNEDWDLVAELGFSDYDLACVEATQAWITRVTGLSEFDRVNLKPRDKKR